MVNLYRLLILISIFIFLNLIKSESIDSQLLLRSPAEEVESGLTAINDQTLSEQSEAAASAALVHKNRTKRFIYKNVYGTFDVGFLIVIPFMIVLPPFSNLFNKWRRKRSLTRFDNNQLFEDEESTLVFEDDPYIQNYLDHIHTYFDLIQIPEPSCQQRAICEFSAEPTKYFPISNLFLTQLRGVPTEYLEILEAAQLNSTAKKPKSLFRQFTTAEEFGLIHGHKECHTRFYEKCFFSTEQRLDMSVIKYWQLLETFLGLKIEESM